MRFLHIADLHVGKVLNDVSLLPDQRHVLEQIIAMAKDEAVDAVLIAGDVYQSASPSAEAMALLDSFITRLAETGAKVVMISGNHDSAARVSYLSGLLRNSGVYTADAFSGRLQTVTLTDAHGEVDVHLLPFVKPAMVRRFHPGAKIATYQDAVAEVLKASPLKPGRRSVLMCHQFVTGAELSDSEERAVGGLDNIDASLFGGFDYVALGHIHKPQRMTRDTLRYAGSPLKYSFSEATHRKSAALVDMDAHGACAVRLLPLNALHDVRMVEGMLDEVVRMDYSEDYVWVTLHDELPPPDARVTLTTVFPNLMKLSIVNSKTRTDIDVLARERMESKSVPELFSDFYRLQNNDQPPSEAHFRLLERVLKEMEGTP